MNKTVTVTVTSTNYKTLGDYIMDYKSPAYPPTLRNNKQTTPPNDSEFDWEAYAREFCSWEPNKIGSQAPNEQKTLNTEPYLDSEKKLESNFARIVSAFKNYPEEQRKIRQSGERKGGYLNLPLKPGIKFSIPLEKVSREALLTQGIEVVSNNEPAFKAKKLQELESDSGYRKLRLDSEPSKGVGNISVQYPNITVWIWCRSLTDEVSPNKTELEGEIFNITPFVTSLNTSSTKNGSNFQIGLTPIHAETDPITGKWLLKNTIISEDLESNLSVFHTHKTVKNRRGDGLMNVRSQNYFHNIISPNDLVFIRFETLEMEKDYRVKDNSEFYVNKLNLGNRIYDLIGLVDKNTITTEFESINSNISISGRDLSKLFIEDGTYFYSMENKDGVLYLQGESTSKNQYTQRIISTNAYLYLGLYYNNSIEDILKFVIQQVSTIKVVPDSLFEGYGNDRNTRYKDTLYGDSLSGDITTSVEKSRQNLEASKKRVIENITKFRVKEFKDLNIPEKIVNNTSIKVFDNLVDFIEHAMDNKNPYDGTDILKYSSGSFGGSGIIGWKDHIYKNEDIKDNVFPNIFSSSDINDGTPLFCFITDLEQYTLENDKENIVSQIYNYIKEKKQFEKLKDTSVEPTTNANGIWQIIKLVIDKKVAQRLLIDNSISSANGSLLNFLKKVASEPFVELLMDTYGSMWYIIVRQPPTDKVGMYSFLEGNYQTTTFVDGENQNVKGYNLNSEENNVKTPAIVEIDDLQIVRENLSFDDSQVYSWYHFVPRMAIIGTASQFTTNRLPALYFEPYAEIWGSKSLDVVHNYTNFFNQYQNDSATEFSNQQLQSYYDLKYLVESNQYIPFTRKGTIVLTGGDRRIKIGNPIHLLSTDEIFWVDSVSQSYMVNNNIIERTTTIQVSRGMMHQFIYGVRGEVLNQKLSKQGVTYSPDKVFSYFNIINTMLNFDNKIKVPIKNKKQVKRIEKVKSLDYTNIQGGYNDGNQLETNIDIRNTINSKFLYQPLTPANEQHILTLKQSVQPTFRAFVNTLESLGWAVIITSSFRSYAKQKKLFEAANKKDVAAPGKSQHNKGLAIDINVIAKKNIGRIKAGTQLILGGKTEAGRKKQKPLWEASGIPEIAKSFKLIWGGNYNNYTDNVHFGVVEETFTNNEPQETVTEREVIEEIEETVGEKELIDQDSVFSNFKVDREVFNFFLRRQQLGLIDVDRLATFSNDI